MTILEIHKEKVRLGIEAPAEVGIFRQEIWAKIQEQQSPRDPVDELDGRRV